MTHTKGFMVFCLFFVPLSFYAVRFSYNSVYSKPETNLAVLKKMEGCWLEYPSLKPPKPIIGGNDGISVGEVEKIIDSCEAGRLRNMRDKYK